MMSGVALRGTFSEIIFVALQKDTVTENEQEGLKRIWRLWLFRFHLQDL